MKYYDIIPIDSIIGCDCNSCRVNKEAVKALEKNIEDDIYQWVFQPIDVTRYSHGLRSKIPPFEYQVHSGSFERYCIIRILGLHSIRAYIDTTFNDDGKDQNIHSFPRKWRPNLGVPKGYKIKEEKIIRKEIIEYPSILVVTFTKNDAKYLRKHLETWERIDYPKKKIRWIWIYGKSSDETLKILDKYFSEGKWNCEIYSDPPFENPTKNALYIADIANAARELYQGEDFVIIDDSDIAEISSSLLIELIKLGLDIVAPYIWCEEDHSRFFDTYVFRDLSGKRYPSFNSPHKDSIEPIELSSVGTFVMMKGEIFEKVKWDNPVPFLQFCRNARKEGYRVWSAPWIGIYHANVEGEMHMPVEYYVERGILPKVELEKVR